MDLPIILIAAAALIFGFVITIFLSNQLQGFRGNFQLYQSNYDGLSAGIIAAAGGQENRTQETWEDSNPPTTPHGRLGLTIEAYKKGLVFLALLVSLAAWLPSMLWMGPIFGSVATILFGLGFGYISHWIVADQIKRDAVAQYRQFPFFLDIYVLTAQANGNLGNAIDRYLDVYNQDAMARELQILQDTLTALNTVEALRRLGKRMADPELRQVIGQLAQKLRNSQSGIVEVLEQQRDDMRNMREEQAAKTAEMLNANFTICQVLALLATILVVLSIPMANILGSGGIL